MHVELIDTPRALCTIVTTVSPYVMVLCGPSGHHTNEVDVSITHSVTPARSRPTAVSVRLATSRHCVNAGM